ncbi:MAG: class I SAM-dependent methyltransferase [Desulfovibrio sp.]
MPLNLLSWLDEAKLACVPTQEYWGNAGNEQGKIFDVAELGFHRLEQNIKIQRAFQQTREMAQAHGIQFTGNTLSIAAGTCWLESWLIGQDAFAKLTCVDFSAHRIHELAPHTLEHYGVKNGEIDLVHGNALQLRVPDKSQDTILICRSFHHFEEPRSLLREMRRILKDDGKVLISGEHYFDFSTRAKAIFHHFRRFMTNSRNYRSIRTFFPEHQMLFPPSFEKGDIHYSKFEYHNMFKATGFDYEHHVDKSKTLQGFILRKSLGNS